VATPLYRLTAPLPAARRRLPAYGRIVIDDAELAAAIDGRPHWQLDDQGAVYAPPGAAAHVRVRPFRTPPRARERYAASVIKNEAALQSTTMPTAVSAVAWAEQAACRDRLCQDDRATVGTFPAHVDVSLAR
jgi:hypothetical protein